MTDGAKPQAGHVAAPKALAELDSPRRLFVFAGTLTYTTLLTSASDET